MYVYIQSEPKLWTVGHYDPEGRWLPESDHGTTEKAAARTRFLNGGPEDDDMTSADGGKPGRTDDDADRFEIVLRIGNTTRVIVYSSETRTGTYGPGHATESPEGTPGEALDWTLRRWIGSED